MKKLLAVAAALLLLTFSACSAGTQSNKADASDYIINEITAWPQNEYTAQVPAPQTGTPAEEIIIPGGPYSVSVKDVSRQECYEYLDLLRENGFASAFPGEENSVSGGWIYTNGASSVTVSQSGSGMVIGVSLEPAR